MYKTVPQHFEQSRHNTTTDKNVAHNKNLGNITIG